jgi:hypothetical protein
MDWCVNDFKECNHAPVIFVNGFAGKELLFLKTKPGDKIELDASKSFDPDGNELRFKWFFYPENSSTEKNIILESEGAMATIVYNGYDKPNIIPLLLKVSDSGNPVLTSYRRILININE